MAYNGTIDVISGFRPKNNGTFPLCEAKDVFVADGKRLDSALDSLQEEINNFQVDVDTTLSIPGAAADAKAVRDALNTLLQSVSASYGDLRSELTTLDESVVKTVNGVAPDDNGNVVVEGGGSDITIDDTLSIQGAAADAKAVGDKASEVATAISYLASKVQNNTSAIGTLETQASDEHIREIVDEVINEALAGDY